MKLIIVLDLSQRTEDESLASELAVVIRQHGGTTTTGRVRGPRKVVVESPVDEEPRSERVA